MKLTPLLLTLIVFACATGSEKNAPDTGTLEGNRYSNNYFSLKLEIPKGWSVQSEEEIKALNEQSKTILEDAQSGLDVNIDSLQNNTVQMLIVFEHEPTDTATFNASFVLMAERMKSEVSSMDERVYLSVAADEFNSSGFYSEVDEAPQKITLGQQPFFALHARFVVENEAEAHQEFFARRINDYMLLIILSYRTKQQYDQLQKVLSSITFG